MPKLAIARSALKIQTIAQQHHLLSLPKPKHPLLSILKLDELQLTRTDTVLNYTLDFFTIAFKKGCVCKLKYGQTPYDFDAGVISFFAPNQIHQIQPETTQPPASGWLISIHPDLFHSTPSRNAFDKYGFFYYGVSESLILSDGELQVIEETLGTLSREYDLPIDLFSEDVLVSALQLLLSFCNRYYTRQFVVRKHLTATLFKKWENVLQSYFDNAQSNGASLPTVTDIATKLHMSPRYLSDCLRSLTGKGAKELIQQKILEHAKYLLLTTDLQVTQISYQLGFEHSQSFNKLFKSKINKTPLEFRFQKMGLH